MFTYSNKKSILRKKYLNERKNFSLEENGATLKFEDLDFINDSTKSMYLILKFINNSAQDTANSGNTGNYIILRDMIGAPNLSVLHSIMEFISFNNMVPPVVPFVIHSS